MYLPTAYSHLRSLRASPYYILFLQDFKDEELDKFFHLYSQLNLKAPMVNCSPHHSRTLIHQGDLRYKDNIKEARVAHFDIFISNVTYSLRN